MTDLNLTPNEVKLLKLYIENSETITTNWEVVAEQGGWKNAKCARDTWGIFKRKKLNASATSSGTTPNKAEAEAATLCKRKTAAEEDGGTVESPTPSKKTKKGTVVKKGAYAGVGRGEVEDEAPEDVVKDEPDDKDA